MERAQFLETTEIFAKIHDTLANSGQTAVPNNLDTDLHFTCFVQAPEASAREAETTTGELRLIELDGRRAGPVDRGKSTDLLKVSATWPRLVHFRRRIDGHVVSIITQDVAKYVKEQIIPKAQSLEFSMIALAGGFSEEQEVLGSGDV